VTASTIVSGYQPSWYSHQYGEIGDLCESMTSAVFAQRYTDGADVFLNGHPYLIQGEWSNALGRCVLGPHAGLTDPRIHVGPAGFGAITNGQTTTETLTARGGHGPCRFYVSNSPSNMASVPSWATLRSDGTLTLNPPAGDQGTYSFYVYAFDNTGQHSPFARDKVSFSTTNPPPAGSCEPSSSLSVLVQGANVTSYVPKGAWDGSSTDVSVVNVEGSSITP